MSELNVQVDVLTDQQSPLVARIALNGYSINEGGVFGRSGAMRSFKMVTGSVRRIWLDQTPVIIRDENGLEKKIRIFAAPAEEGAVGFVEFL